MISILIKNLKESLILINLYQNNEIMRHIAMQADTEYMKQLMASLVVIPCHQWPIKGCLDY